MPKKKFIDKKKAVTFHLVHRSQRDPLVADETAPQHVLLPVGEKSAKKQENKEAKKEEERKFGVFFDDDYDYLQHLRPVGEMTTEWEPVVENFRISRNESLGGPSVSTEKPFESPLPASKIQLPSSVFASHVEEEVGLLNRAAPQSGLRLDLDPDIVAAMDDDFDFEDPDNVLEDNFMEMANASGDDMDDDGDGSDDESWTDESDEDEESEASEEMDEVMSLSGPQLSFSGEETKSRFTEYSMTSSVMRRNNQLTLLDDRFEQMFAAYDDSELGALDCEDIEGHVEVDSDLVLQCAEEFQKQKAKSALGDVRLASGSAAVEESASDSEDDMMDLSVAPRKMEKWDCESVLTSKSTLYNHPTIIPSERNSRKPIKISTKTGIPVGVLSERRGLTAKALANLDATNREEGRCDDDASSVAVSVLSTLSIRPKGETSEDRQARKHALKDYRRERRVERKANKLAFKEEKKKQEKLIMHNKICANSVKI